MYATLRALLIGAAALVAAGSQGAKELIESDRDVRFGDLRNMQADLSEIDDDGSVIPFISSTNIGTGDTILRVD